MSIHEGNKFYPTRHPQVKQCSILLPRPTMGKHTTNVSKNRGNSILCEGPKMGDTQQMSSKTQEIPYFL